MKAIKADCLVRAAVPRKASTTEINKLLAIIAVRKVAHFIPAKPAAADEHSPKPRRFT